MYLVICPIKKIFNSIYNIIKDFKIQLTMNLFWMIMVKTVIWTLGMIKIRSLSLNKNWKVDTAACNLTSISVSLVAWKDQSQKSINFLQLAINTANTSPCTINLVGNKICISFDLFFVEFRTWSRLVFSSLNY